MDMRIKTMAVFIMLSSFGCNQSPQSPGLQYGNAPSWQPVPVYILAVHPLHNPRTLNQTYQPLVNYLNRHIAGARLELEASHDYGSFDAKLRAALDKEAMLDGKKVLLVDDDMRNIFSVSSILN
jgi:hypothetical protein